MSDTISASNTAPVVVSSGGVGPAIGSMGVGASIMVIVTWFCGLHGIVIPGEVALAMGGLLSSGLHYTQDWFFNK